MASDVIRPECENPFFLSDPWRAEGLAVAPGRCSSPATWRIRRRLSAEEISKRFRADKGDRLEALTCGNHLNALKEWLGLSAARPIPADSPIRAEALTAEAMQPV